MAECEPPRSAAETLLDASGFFLGLLILVADYPFCWAGLSPTERAFFRSPKVAVWFYLVAAQFAFWTNAVGPLWRRLIRIRRDYHPAFTGTIRIKAAFTFLLLALPVIFLGRIDPGSHLLHYREKQAIINVAALAVACVPILGIWSIRETVERACGAKGTDGLSKEVQRDRLAMLVRLRHDLRAFIVFLGAMIGLGTLARGMFRHANLAFPPPAPPSGGEPFATEYVLLYGAYFSGLLALIYVPAHSILASAGRDLLHSVFRIRSPDLDPKALGDWQRNRQALEDLLELRTGALDTLKASLSVLAPLISSIVSLATGAKLS